MLLLAFGAWDYKRVRETQEEDGLCFCASTLSVRVCGFQTQLTGWVLAADYRMLDCILIVSLLEEEDE